MRPDVVELSIAEMSPELKTLILFERNGSLSIEDPQAAFGHIIRTTPVVRWDHGVGFFTMQDVLAAARNKDIVSMEPESKMVVGMGSADPLIPLHIDGELHTRFRRLLDPLFAPRKVAPLESTIRDLADDLIDRFIDVGWVDLYENFCVPLPTTVFLALFGLPLKDAPELLRMKDAILKNEGADLEEHEALGRAAGLELRKHLRMRLDERRADARARTNDDLLNTILAWEVEGERLTDDEIVNVMHLLTIAGLDTISGSLSLIFHRFASNPDELARVVADPQLLNTAIEELMRFETPTASSGARWAARDTEVNGVPIHKGEMVYLCWAAANLDPHAFSEPLEVDLSRPANRHLTFASGTHRCLGSHLARHELRVAVAQFHERIPDYRLDPDQRPEFEFFGMRLATRLPITFPVPPS